MSEPIFRVWDNKNQCWAGEWGGRSLEDYALNEFKGDHLIYCDMEGFTLAPDGSLLLHDECGNYAYCDPAQFEICFPKEFIDSMKPSPSGNYLVITPPTSTSSKEVSN
jgi:hypothetical protein